jgi:hypothetical protein
MNNVVRFMPVQSGGVERWSRPNRFDFFHRLPAAPISDTELLHVSHYCPVAFAQTDEGPQVVILVAPRYSRFDPTGGGGPWRVPYVPIALRHLPFWPGDRPAEIRVAPELAAAGEPSFGLREEDGSPTPQFALVVSWMERLQRGMLRLSEAARILLAADLLSPIVVREAGTIISTPTGYHMVDRQKFASLSPARAAALSVSNGLPLDLAAASIYSQRLLAAGLNVAEETGSPADEARHRDEPPGLLDPLDPLVRIDLSDLFSFESFVGEAAAETRDEA